MNVLRLVSFGAALALGVALTPARAEAQPHRPHKKKPPLALIAKIVGLDAKQVAAIKKVSFASERQAIKLRAKLQLAHLELRQTMEADKAPSEARLTALVTRVGTLETEMKKIHLLRLLRVRRTMSLVQWRKLEAFHARHGAPRGPAAPAPPRPPGPPRAPR